LKQIKEFELEITDIAYGGKGVGRFNGKVIFVPHALPGEVVRVKIKKEQPNYTNAIILKILQASPERIDSDCLVPVGADVMGIEQFAQTPGCVYQHFSYQEEIRIKAIQFASFLSDFFTIDKVTSIPAPNHLHYRNKIILHTMDDHGDISLGYCAEKGSEVLDMPSCPLAVDAINDTLCEIRNKSGFYSTIREGMTLTLRSTENDGVSWWRNTPKKNSSWLKEKTVLGNISVPVGSFFQVNMGVTDILIQKVTDIISEYSPDSVVDLYCGCGLFSIAAGKSGISKISGLDCDKNSIDAALYNAKQHDLKNLSFSADFADKGFDRFIENHIAKFDTKLSESVLIIDPPRGGLGRRVRGALQNCDFKAIVYISCAPDTLKRDMVSFDYYGYHIKSAEMLDMFPRTSHFESIVVLEK